MQSLGESVLGELTRVGPLTSVELGERLSQPVTAVQEVLLECDQVFVRPPEGSDKWSVVSSDDMAQRLGMNRGLRPWQVDAFQRWLVAGRAGVIEAVTGAGKTDVGVAAIADARRRGVPTLVLLPDRDLADHWRGVLETAFPGVKVGTPHSTRAIAVAEQMVVTTIEGLGNKRLTAFREAGLLVVDEIQRFGAATLTASVFPREGLTEKLGLTASYEWSNAQIQRVLRPYFGERISGCSYTRAVDEGILGKPLVLTVGVSFSSKERDEYEALSRRIESAERKLRDTGADLSAGIYETARDIDSGSLVGEISFLAHEYLEAVDARRRVTAMCQSKIQAVAEIARGVATAQRTTVFTDPESISESIAEVVSTQSGVTADFISSSSNIPFTIGRFSSEAVKVLATARLMDEGVPVPTSQVGIVTAAARSRAQMLQRMGRVVHPADWALRSAIVVVYVNATIEDPDVGSLAETHLDELVPIAAQRRDVDPQEAADRLKDWLSPRSDVEDIGANEIPVPVVETEIWDPRGAILDIVAEHEGLLTWRELRDLLPDLEVEDALMNGLDELNWMRVGGVLAGIGDVKVRDSDRRIVALDALARARDVLGEIPTSAPQIRAELGSAAEILRTVSSERLGEFWQSVGGRIELPAAAGPESQDAATPLPDTGDVQVAPEAVEPLPEPRAHVSMSPAIRAVIEQIGVEGGEASLASDHVSGTLEIRDPAGRTKLVRVHSGIGGNWRVRTTDGDLGERTAEHDAIIFLDRGTTPPKFYIAPVGPYAKRVKAVVEARARSNPRDRHADHINIEAWVVEDGLDRWDLLGLGVPRKRPIAAAASDEVTTAQTDIREERVTATAPPDLQWSADNELRVILDFDGHRIVGFFDPESTKLRIARAPGISSLAGKEFRNPAVAAGTIKSKIAKRTLFGVGYDDWVVDENTRETLAGYLETTN